MNKIVFIDESRCISCGQCVDICLKKILYLDKKTKKCKITDESLCDKFRGCEYVCSQGAIKILNPFSTKENGMK